VASVAGRRHMRFERGKIDEVVVSPRWRVEHRAGHVNETAIFDIVPRADEDDARDQVRRAYTRPRAIISIERLD
jgi:hypothetical protein